MRPTPDPGNMQIDSALDFTSLEREILRSHENRLPLMSFCLELSGKYLLWDMVMSPIQLQPE